jgi:glucose-1-phosphate adenylyltransferase
MAAGVRVLGIVLAGGEGKRLWPLTADRAKPAVPFGGNYRLIDFVLSNMVNAGFLRICVLTQYKSHSLDRHISTTWRLSSVLGQYITTVPAQQRLGRRWYTGSADAIFQSLNLVYDERPDHIAVFGADHVYRMDPGQMIAQHVDSGAGVTVAGIRVPRAEAKAFGCIASDESGRITEFLEKPPDPPSVPGGCAGFSRNWVIRPDSSLSLQPNANASLRGTRIPATVTPAPEAMCWATICSGSIR